jgi:hypothetical protein
MKTKLNEISKEIYEANKLKGFDVKNENLSQTLLLIVSEITEAQDALRKKRAPVNWEDHNAQEIWHYGDDEKFKKLFNEHIKDTFEDEIADTFMRLMDLVGALEIDIDSHIELKRRFNSLREFKHGKSF